MNKYNIHGLITIQIERGLEDTNRIVDFLNHMTDNNIPISNNKIIISKVKQFDLSKHREYADGIFISPESIIDIKYGIEVINRDSVIELRTKFRYIEWMMFAIQLALLKVDCVLIHGAAVSKDGDATLFPSWGGVGKTAILNDFAKKYNYKIIGDDLFILNRNGDIFSFPKPMVLYPYHKNLFPEIFKKNPSLLPVGMTKFVSRMVPKIKKMLSPFPALMNYARNHNPQVRWALPVEVFGKDKIASKTHIKSVFWLERSVDATALRLSNSNIESQILGSTINEFDQKTVFSTNILMGLGILNNDNYFQKWNSILERGLKEAQKGYINVNTSVSIDEIGRVIKGLLDENQK